MNRHTIGALHEIQAASFMVKYGWEIYFPFLTQSRCDFIACKGRRTLKVQVKTVSKNKSGPFSYKQCRLTSRFNHEYLPEDYDLLIAVDPDGGAYVVRHCEILGQTSLCFGSSNPEYKPKTGYTAADWFVPACKFN